MRYPLLLLLSLAGCSSLGLGGSTSKAPPPPSAARAVEPAPSGIEPSSHSAGDVSDVQRKLSDSGFYHGPFDGKWGPASSAAARDYQRAHNLPVTGLADHATLVSMGLQQPDSPPAGYHTEPNTEPNTRP